MSDKSDRPRYDPPKHDSSSCKPKKTDRSIITMVVLMSMAVLTCAVYAVLDVVDQLEEKGVSFVEYYGERDIIFSSIIFSISGAILFMMVKSMLL